MKSARWLLSAALACAGCASVSPKGSFEDVSALVAARGGARIHWDQGTPADEQVRAHVRGLLTGTLTSDGAFEVALLRNQGLVATYEQLGIAQADLVQAGLLRNPGPGARVRFPTSGPGTFIDTGFSVAQDFLGIFTLPLRKRVAAAQLDAANARVGGAVQIEGYRDYLETVRDYWIARADLERASGGSLDAQLPKEKSR